MRDPQSTYDETFFFFFLQQGHSTKKTFRKEGLSIFVRTRTHRNTNTHTNRAPVIVQHQARDRSIGILRLKTTWTFCRFRYHHSLMWPPQVISTALGIHLGYQEHKVCQPASGNFLLQRDSKSASTLCGGFLFGNCPRVQGWIQNIGADGLRPFFQRNPVPN